MNKSHFITPIAICFGFSPNIRIPFSHASFCCSVEPTPPLSKTRFQQVAGTGNSDANKLVGKQCSCAETKVETEICTMSRVQSRLTRISTTRQTQLGVLVKYQSSLPNGKLLDVQRSHRHASSSFKSRDKYLFAPSHQTFVLRVDASYCQRLHLLSSSHSKTIILAMFLLVKWLFSESVSTTHSPQPQHSPHIGRSKI